MVEIIAEIGVNHDGDLDKAKRLIEVAHECGADYAKFQTFKASALVTEAAPTAEYQKSHHDGDQHSMLARLEFTPDQFRELKAHAGRVGIGFLSTPFDSDSLDFLLELGMKTIKVGSGEVTNLPFLAEIGRGGVRTILSTGMSNLDEVSDAVATLRDAGCPQIVLLHCVTEYPAPVDQINLMAMLTLAEEFDVPVGYSDHTQGDEVVLASVALGAEVIEKHLTLDPTAPGPDHAASSSPDQFARMVQGIRAVESCLGDGVKEPAACEIGNMKVARKSLVAARDIAAGSELKPDDLAIKRPGTGISPARYEDVIGRKAARAVARDQVLTWEDLDT